MVKKDGADPGEAKVFWAHAPPQGACENLVCALNLLVHLQKSGIDTIFEGFAGAKQTRRRR